MIDSPSTPYERTRLTRRAANRAELVVSRPDGTAFTWTPEEEAQVVTALRVAAALLPAGAAVVLRLSDGPTTLHRESVGDE